MNSILRGSRRNWIVWTLGLALGGVAALTGACSDDASLPPADDDGRGGPGTVVAKDAATDDPDATALSDATTEADADELDATLDADTDGSVSPTDAGGDASDGQAQEGEAPPEGRCRTTADCTDPKLGCFFYVEPNCDPQTTNYCLNDDACTAIDPDLVCATPRASCGAACIPGCDADSDCKLGTTCNTLSRHCILINCASAADCPNGNFSCNNSPPQGAFCGRRACTKDDDCEGRCVTEKSALSGYCVEDWGFCAQQ